MVTEPSESDHSAIHLIVSSNGTCIESCNVRTCRPNYPFISLVLAFNADLLMSAFNPNEYALISIGIITHFFYHDVTEKRQSARIKGVEDFKNFKLRKFKLLKSTFKRSSWLDDTAMLF